MSTVASAQTVINGTLAHDDLIAVRYRSFANTGGDEIFLGIPDLGVGAHRTGTNLVWQPGANSFSFTYDKLNDKLIATVVNGSGSTTLNYPTVSTNIGGACSVTTTQRCGRPGDPICPGMETCTPFSLAALNVMQINIANRDANTTVDLSGVLLDGSTLGTGTFSGGVGAPGNFLSWTVTNYCFGGGFTINGTVTLGGTFSGSQENDRVDILVGIKDGGVCRAVGGVCDVAESCDGSGPVCPADAYQSSGVCRASAGVCDLAESCNGAGPNCPADAYQSNGVCRASAGVCDVAESCNGAGPNCPADAYQSSGVCRASAGVCDLAESCNGAGPNCPADAYQSSGVCRASAGVCDVAESCNGAGPNCPANGFVADGTVCNDGSVCTTIDQCATGACVGSAPLDCDDGSACTVDTCDPTTGCESSGGGPIAGCRTAAKNLLVLRQSGGTKDKLIWKWVRGQATSVAELSDPLTTADYSLCIYAGIAGTLVADAHVTPGSGWTALGAKGFKYRDLLGAQDGIQKQVLRASTVSKSRIAVKGKGANLPDPVLPLAEPVIVQMVNNQTDICWESSFPIAKTNEVGRYKAKAQP